MVNKSSRTWNQIGTFFLLSAAIILLSFSSCPAASPRTSKTIFLVSSYERGEVCGQPQEDGLLEELDRQGYSENHNLRVLRYYMNSKRINTSAIQIAQQGEIARKQIAENEPDLIVTLDDNAAREVMLPYIGSSTPVVFSGINRLPESYDEEKDFIDEQRRPLANVTGVYEKLQLTHSLDLISEIIPSGKKVAALVDCTPSGDAVARQLADEYQRHPGRLEFSITRIGSVEELEGTIEKINQDPEICAYFPVLTALKCGGQTCTSPEIIPMLLQKADKPELAINFTYSRMGFFGGAAVDFKAMGIQAGTQAAKILSGTPVSALPVEDVQRFAIVFNLTRAKDLNINIPPELIGAADKVYNQLPLPTRENPLHISLVHSYEKDKGCGPIIEQGMLTALAEFGYKDGEKLIINRLYMDSRSNNLETPSIRAAGQSVLEQIDKQAPDMIIIFDDNAIEHVMLPLAKSHYPIFFAGMNISPEKYNQIKAFMINRRQPGFNITGITEETDHEQSFKLTKELFPKARTMVVVSSSNTLFLRRMNSSLRQWFEDNPELVPFTIRDFIEVKTMADYQETMLRLAADPEVDLIYPYVPISLQRPDGSGAPLAEALQWTFSNINKPGMTWMIDFVKMGFLATIGIDLDACGRQLAGKIEKAFNGIPIAEIPIDLPHKYAIALNQARANQLGIKLPLELLESAKFVFQEMTACQPGGRD